MLPSRLRGLWFAALIAASVGTLVLYDARPGINFVIWVAVAVAGIVSVRHHDHGRSRAFVLPAAFALVLAAGAAITANPLFHAVIIITVASLLGLTTVLAAAAPRPDEYGPVYILTAPFRAFARTLKSSVQTCIVTLDAFGTARMHPAVRGAIAAIPIAIIFALMFASADPVFARGRDAIASAFTSWDFMPRVIFWSLLTLFTLGAYAVVSTGAAQPRGGDAAAASTTGTSWTIGDTERVVVLGTVAAVSWLFVLLQVAYLFGNPVAVIGSGVTFAEYARRGFGELAVVATLAVALIIGAQDLGRRRVDGTTTSRQLDSAALILLAAVVGILISAVHRVALYEGAYGYTTARLYAQAYMAMTLLILALVAREVIGSFNTPRLARGVMTTALATLVVIVYWNSDAWIVRQNLGRFASTGKIDIAYIVSALSADAYPTLVRALPSLPEPTRTQVADGIALWAPRKAAHDDAWYEWNLRRREARMATATLPRVVQSSD